MRKVGTAWIGGDLTGNARGSGALDIQSKRDSVTQVADQTDGIIYGMLNENHGTSSTVVGYQNIINISSLKSLTNPSRGCNIFGFANQAEGLNSTAIGTSSSAIGDECTAVGAQCNAVAGDDLQGGSTAIGSLATASGGYCTAIGVFCDAAGVEGATAIGAVNSASASLTTAIGYSNVASAEGAIAIGYSNVASAEVAIAIGFNNVARTEYSAAIGSGSEVANNNTTRLNSSGSSGAYVRLHGNTGMCAFTVQNRATEYDDAKRSQSVTITRAGTAATVTLANHGYSVGALVTIAGATQTAYNGSKTITAANTNEFVYEVLGSPATPATGTITAVAADKVERDNTLARGEFAIRRNGLQFILDYNDGGTIKNIILGTAT
jgi:hypothetical protein